MKNSSINYFNNLYYKKHIFLKNIKYTKNNDDRNSSPKYSLPIMFHGDLIKYQIAEINNGKIVNNNPYIELSSAEDLVALSNSPEQWSNKRFRLSTDIDLSTIQNWKPIGDKDNPFTSKFDGNQHIISNLTIDNKKIIKAFLVILKMQVLII